MDKNNSSSIPKDPTSRTLYKTGIVFCILGTLIPLLTLAGRIVNYPYLLKITPGGIIVQNPLSSFCFIFIGISLWLLRREKDSPWKKTGRGISLLISLIGFLKVIFVSLKLDFGFDLIFFKNQLSVPYGYGENGLNAMAPNTAFCFFLLGLSIFFIDTKSFKRKVLMQYLDFFILLISLLSIYGYIYQVKDLYSVFNMIPMSFFTGVCFFIFSSAVLFLRSDKGTMAVLVGENPTEVFLLRFIAMIIPLVFGWLKIKGEKMGLFPTELGTAVFAILTFVLTMFFIGRKSSIQYKLRKTRSRMNEIIREDNERMVRVLGNSPTYINIYDLKTDMISYSNNIGSRQLGYSTPITKMTFSNFIEMNVHPEDIPKVKERILKFKNLKDNEYNELIYRLVAANKEIHWLYSRAMVYKKSNDEVSHILLNATDITALKKVEFELSESKRFIERVAKATPNLLYIYDLNEGKNIYANRNFNEMLGYPPEQIKLLGSELLPSLIHPQDLCRLKEYHEGFKRAKENEVREIEYRIKSNKGDWIWLASRDTEFLRDSNNMVLQIIGIARDVTLRKQNEEKLKENNKELIFAYHELGKIHEELKKSNIKLEERVRLRTIELKESEEKYKAFIKQSSEGIWRYEFDIPYIDITLPIEKQVDLILKHGFVAESNDKMAHTHGFDSAEQVVGARIGNTWKLDDKGKVQLVINFINSGYRLINQPTIDINKKGGLSYFRSTVIGMIEENKLLRVWGTQQDITDKEIALEDLRKSEEYYKLIIENIPEIFWVANAEGSIDFYNQTWYEYSGSDSKAIKNKDLFYYLHPDDLPEVKNLWMNSVNKDIEFRAEYRLKRFDGIYRWHLGKAIALKSKEGKTVKWMGTSTDIQDLKILHDYCL